MSEENNKHQLLAEWFPLKEEKHNTKTEKLPKVTDGEVLWVAVGESKFQVPRQGSLCRSFSGKSF